jgi:hypothetical protein|tara:strand:- start:530 stop:742 length:213 start_codon:yes stop_codon:yes gene_type:complete
MGKYNKDNISKLLLFNELLDKQKQFIENYKLNEFTNDLDFDNFVSNEENNLPLDKNGFIDFKKMEEDGEI